VTNCTRKSHVRLAAKRAAAGCLNLSDGIVLPELPPTKSPIMAEKRGNDESGGGLFLLRVGQRADFVEDYPNGFFRTCCYEGAGDR